MNRNWIRATNIPIAVSAFGRTLRPVSRGCQDLIQPSPENSATSYSVGSIAVV